MSTDKKIPISSAKAIGEKLGYTQVIVTAFDKETGITSVTTWGKSQEDCEQAAAGGNFVKKAIGWPPEKCNDKPQRQIDKEKAGPMHRYNIGDKVHYDNSHGKIENGIVKSVQEGSAFVVYNCDDDWDNYQEYTGSRTHFEHLRSGWITQNS